MSGVSVPFVRVDAIDGLPALVFGRDGRDTGYRLLTIDAARALSEQMADAVREAEAERGSS